MIQGTMSGAGKSMIAAGLCRIFREDGYRTAPFKSQNMALNSFITDEGLEMGRAQVMQAEAAGIAPKACMNPILLKPTNDTGSQVIVMGKVLGNMDAREYFQYKKKLFPVVRNAYDSLASMYDIIVIEGAGSPAEINLHSEDIVNMGMAEMADAPVLLAGDIDRGGVFAQLYGTVSLLTPSERDRVKGLIINKFRGDRSILDPGVAMLEEKCGIPVLGVCPYLDVRLEDEDSLTDRFEHHSAVGQIDIAVIRLPRISNFSDFNIFETIPGVTLRYVGSTRDLGAPDMIILPGTKNTMGDLKWMRQNGLEASIQKASASGTIVFGVCGGYQMLGRTLSDPHHSEEGGEMQGLCLLDIDTVFAPQKTRTRVTGSILPLDDTDGMDGLGSAALEGYEIHMGETSLTGDTTAPFTSVTDQNGMTKYDGARGKNVFGTYIHGIFDREDVSRSLIEALGKRKGLDMSKLGFMDYQDFKETQYRRLAEGLRKSLKMDEIYKIMKLDRNIQ